MESGSTAREDSVIFAAPPVLIRSFCRVLEGGDVALHQGLHGGEDPTSQGGIAGTIGLGTPQRSRSQLYGIWEPPSARRLSTPPDPRRQP